MKIRDRIVALLNNQAFCVIVVLLFLAAVAWANLAWEKWRASIYADEFQRRGLAPQAVPK